MQTVELLPEKKEPATSQATLVTALWDCGQWCQLL